MPAQIFGTLLLLPNLRKDKPLVLRCASGRRDHERRLARRGAPLDHIPVRAYREGVVDRRGGALLLAMGLVPRNRDSEHYN